MSCNWGKRDVQSQVWHSIRDQPDLTIYNFPWIRPISSGSNLFFLTFYFPTVTGAFTYLVFLHGFTYFPRYILIISGFKLEASSVKYQFNVKLCFIGYKIDADGGRLKCKSSSGNIFI